MISSTFNTRTTKIAKRTNLTNFCWKFHKSGADVFSKILKLLYPKSSFTKTKKQFPILTDFSKIRQSEISSTINTRTTKMVERTNLSNFCWKFHKCVADVFSQILKLSFLKLSFTYLKHCENQRRRREKQNVPFQHFS